MLGNKSATVIRVIGLQVLHFALSHMVSNGLTWSHMVSDGLTWYHMVSDGLTWYHMVYMGRRYSKYSYFYGTIHNYCPSGHFVSGGGGSGS